MADCHSQHAGKGDKDQRGDTEHQRPLAVQCGTDDRGQAQPAHDNRVGEQDVVGADALVQRGLGLLVAVGRSGPFVLWRRGGSGLRGSLDRLRCCDLRLRGCLRRGGRGLHGGHLQGAGILGSGLLCRCCGGRHCRGKAGLAVFPVAVGAEMLLLGAGLGLAGSLPLGLTALDLLQHGAALGLGVARAAGGDDDGIIVGSGVARGRCRLLLRLYDRLFGHRGPGLHGGDGLLDLSAGGPLLCHAAGSLHHLFSDMRDDQRFGAFLAPALTRFLLHWQDAAPPLS